jgi:hypothetical protein
MGNDTILSMIRWWNSLHREYQAVAMLIILLVAIFGWLFWMIGEAAYNQSVPR